MAVRGLDLAAEWRSRRWRRLLNIIDHLPGNSAYSEALAGDEELAALILAHPYPDGAPVVRVSEWSSERAVLAEISDKLSMLISTTVAAAGSRPPKPVPSPRPRVAADRLREEYRAAAHLSLVGRVIPDRTAADVEFSRLSRIDTTQ